MKDMEEGQRWKRIDRKRGTAAGVAGAERVEGSRNINDWKLTRKFRGKENIQNVNRKSNVTVSEN